MSTANQIHGRMHHVHLVASEGGGVERRRGGVGGAVRPDAAVAPGLGDEPVEAVLAVGALVDERLPRCHAAAAAAHLLHCNRVAALTDASGLSRSTPTMPTRTRGSRDLRQEGRERAVALGEIHVGGERHPSRISTMTFRSRRMCCVTAVGGSRDVASGSLLRRRESRRQGYTVRHGGRYTVFWRDSSRSREHRRRSDGVRGRRDGGALYRRSLSSQIAQRVRADILAGRLSPGQRVSQHKLAQTYGTSRIPARDALRELEQEGFLVKGPAGGTSVVSRVTADDITDVFSILATALAVATRRATQAATAEGVASLRAIHARMSEAAAEGNATATFGELNWSLHRQITRLAGSDKLRATIRSISSSIPVAYPEFPLPVAEIVAEKGAILDAIEARDAATASALMEVHVKKEGSGLVDYIRRRELLEG